MKSNLVSRLATAFILAPLIVLLIFWSNPYGFGALVVAAVGVSLFEFYGMTLPLERAGRGVGIAAGVGFSVALFMWPQGGAGPLFALTFATLGIFIFYLVRFGDMSTVSVRFGMTLAGILYVALLLTPLANLKRLPHGPGWVLLTLCICWFGDTGAYFAGRFLGKHKLYPAVSPAKTIEGAVGGLLASLGAALLAKAWYLPELTLLNCALLALPAGALGQAGDLCESLLKRSCGVKDSGNILPGHGGILDRIDAVLFATPYVYFYVSHVVS